MHNEFVMHIQEIFINRSVTYNIIGPESTEVSSSKGASKTPIAPESRSNKNRKKLRKSQRISNSEDADDDVKRGDSRRNCQISDNEDADNKVKRKDSRKNRWVEDTDNKVKRKDSRNQRISDSEDATMITSRRRSKNRRLNSDEGERKRAEENSSFETEEESIEKGSRRHSSRPLINAESVGFKRYNNLNEMGKDLKEALRVNKFYGYYCLFSLYFNLLIAINYLARCFLEYYQNAG